MNLEDQFRLLVGGYYGVREMDEYDLKCYVLQKIEDYIKKYIHENPIENFNYREEALKLESIPLKVKLQDALLVLNKLNESIELILLIKKRLRQINEEEMQYL